MSKIPTLERIVQSVENLGLAKRQEAPQGRKPVYSDSYIIALAIYQKLARFKYAQQMLEVLESLGKDVPVASTFAARKARLVPQLISAVRALCLDKRVVKQHLDSKKLEVIDFTRANRTKLAGGYGHDHIHNRIFYGFRLHARADPSRTVSSVITSLTDNEGLGPRFALPDSCC